MPAHVQEGAHLAAAVAHHENRVLAHIGREKIAGLRDLAFMAQEEPAAGKDTFLLLFVDLRLDEDATGDQSPVGIDETSDVLRH
jgi:hypothetical protein